MKLNLFTKIKLFHTNFRRTHEIIYSFIYYVYMIMAIFFVLIGSAYFWGAEGFASPDDALEMFSTGVWYILMMIVIIPTIFGLKKWKKYLFPGTYKTITTEMAKEIIKEEKFINPIPILEEIENKHIFLESNNYFWFERQLVQKNEIEELKFEIHKVRKSRTHYCTVNILLKNGLLLKNFNLGYYKSPSIYRGNPIEDYLKNYQL